MQFKRAWKQVDGVLLLDKPIGLTSNDALQKARRLFSAAKGGHTVDSDQELIATGTANLGSGILSGMGVAGSLSKTAAAERAGLRAATLNSSNFEEWNTIEAALTAGTMGVAHRVLESEPDTQDSADEGDGI